MITMAGLISHELYTELYRKKEKIQDCKCAANNYKGKKEPEIGFSVQKLPLKCCILFYI